MSDIALSILMLAIGYGLGWVSRWGLKKKVEEARFDTKTGKQLKND